ncbi:hypothetical protein SDJN02_25678, partial [Cucurbita argyrosperma subsp. argyrosperma]
KSLNNQSSAPTSQLAQWRGILRYFELIEFTSGSSMKFAANRFEIFSGKL